MGQLLHGSAPTTQPIRRSTHRRQESHQTRVRRHSLEPKTGPKWRKRTTTPDAPLGPKPASMGLTVEEAAMAAFRPHTLLPLDECLYALQEPIPHRARGLPVLAQRHGVSRTIKEATVQRYHYESTAQLEGTPASLFAGLQPRQAAQTPARPDPA